MRIEAALVEFLRRSGVKPIRGKAQGDAGFPRLHYWMVSNEGTHSVTGQETKNQIAKFRFEAVGRGERGYEDARAQLDGVESAQGGEVTGLDLTHYRGWMPSTGSERVWIQSLRHEATQAEGEDQSVDPRAKSIFVVGLDLTISYYSAEM